MRFDLISRTFDKTLILTLEGIYDQHKEESVALEYLDENAKGARLNIEYFLYPETSFSVEGSYINKEYDNYVPGGAKQNTGYNLLEGIIGWTSTISNNVSLKMLFIDRYLLFEDSKTDNSYSYKLFVKTKMSPRLKLGTRFEWVRDPHRSMDSNTRLTKGVTFLADYILGPSWSGSSDVSYKLRTYNKPYIRNELQFEFHTNLTKEFMDNYSLYGNYHFDFVKSDDKGINIYGNEELKTYRQHKFLMGVKYSY